METQIPIKKLDFKCFSTIKNYNYSTIKTWKGPMGDKGSFWNQYIVVLAECCNIV